MQIIIIHDETAYLANIHVKITRFCEENKIDSTVRSFPGVREAVQDLQIGKCLLCLFVYMLSAI